MRQRSGHTAGARYSAFSCMLQSRGLSSFMRAVIIVVSLPSHADDDQYATNARLLVSVRNADSAGIERALRDGAAVNSRNRLGESALLIALKQNRPDIAQVLLAAGANVNEAAVNGVTPLMAAAYAGQVEMARTLLERGAKPLAVDRI